DFGSFLPDGKTCRRLKERMRRLAPVDVGHTVNFVTRSGIAVFDHHDRLKIRRIPLLRDNIEWLIVAFLARRNRQSRTHTLRLYAFHLLRAERFRLMFGFVSAGCALSFNLALARFAHGLSVRIKWDLDDRLLKHMEHVQSAGNRIIDYHYFCLS